MDYCQSPELMFPIDRDHRKIFADASKTFTHPGVNIKILRVPFLYKSVLNSFSLVTVCPCNFLAQEYWRKSCS